MKIKSYNKCEIPLKYIIWSEADLSDGANLRLKVLAEFHHLGLLHSRVSCYNKITYVFQNFPLKDIVNTDQALEQLREVALSHFYNNLH